MSKIIPPLVSDSPPPPPEEEDEDEEFDEFRGSNDISYGCDSFSLTPSPEHTPKKLPKEGLSINELDCEFQFESVSPEISKKEMENLEVNNVKSLKDSAEIRSENLNHVNEYAFHNSFHKDNIPSQFIIQNSEKEMGECDNDRTINRVQVINEAIIDKQVSNRTDQPHDENNSDEITNEETNSLSNESQGQMDVAKLDVEQEQSVPFDFKDDLHSVHSTQDNDLVNSKFEELSDSLKENSCSNSKDFIFEEDSHHAKQESKDYNVLEGNGSDSKDDFSSFCDGGDSKEEDFSSFCGQLENFNPFPTLPDECQSNNDFANFAAFPPMPENDSKQHEDDFDDFTSFPGELAPALTNLADSKVSDDEFDDFGEFTSTTIPQSEPPKAFLLIDEKEAFKKTEEIVKDIFVQQEEAFNEFQYSELGKNDAIFTQLQDITDTPALSYNWSKSSSQKLLLKALNIDSRNLLYGPSWNSSIPRFAANLGNQPLEPVRMEPLTPTPIEPSPTVPQCSQPQQDVVEIPSAEFDWTGSGLVNPLDYSQTTLLDIEQLVASLDIPNTNPAQRTSIFDEDWDVWLKHAPVEPPAKSPEDDYEEFAEFQHSKPPSEWPNVPLRETHISDDPRGDIDIDVVLQPTIVTPEMPRKTPNTEDYLESKNALDSQAIDETTVQAKDESDDDDFTEFHSSAPASVVVAAPILQPTLVYAPSASTEINWPDPGVTEDELKRFEEAFSTTKPKKEPSPVERGKDDARENLSSIEKVENATVVETVGVQQADSDSRRRSISIWDSPPVKRNESKKPDTKQNSFEDEEWSDFVSVQKLSPVHKTKNSDRNQTASPDLPLSVLNLGNIQPAKQPIPVITPQGLVQTKLSSNMNPPVQPKAVYQRPVNPYDMPSLISNQYASQAYGLSAASKPSQSAQNGQDDDEWGEFVSNTLPQQYQNSSIASGHHSWNNFVPNAGHGGQAGVNLQKKSSNLSSLVLPELDFLALRERNGVPKKK